jgi:hypothetical protein
VEVFACQGRFCRNEPGWQDNPILYNFGVVCSVFIFSSSRKFKSSPNKPQPHPNFMSKPVEFLILVFCIAAACGLIIWTVKSVSKSNNPPKKDKEP